MAGDFVFVLLFSYCQQGISKSFCLKFGWRPESKTEASLTYLSFYLESAALAVHLGGQESPRDHRGCRANFVPDTQCLF